MPTGMDAKGAALLGGALSDEALASSTRVLAGGRHGSGVGLQQYFTPPEAAELIADVFGRNLTVLDPTAGAGDLLAPYPHHLRFGIEIDADHATRGTYRALNGDVQKALSLLRVAGAQFSRIVSNPPFGLTWQHATIARGKTVNSSHWITLACVDLLQRNGVAAVICGTDRLDRELLADQEVKAAAWARVDVSGPLFDGVDLPTSILLLTSPLNRTDAPIASFTATRDELTSLAEDLTAAMSAGCGHVTSASYLDPPAATLDTIIDVYKRRHRTTGPAKYDLRVVAGKLRVSLGALGKLIDGYRPEMQLLRRLDRQPVSYFAVNQRDWHEVRRLLDEDLILAEPGTVESVQAAIDAASLLLRPMYPIPSQMRLGFLDDLDRIRCVSPDPERGFEAGEHYPITVNSAVSESETDRPVERRDKTIEIRKVRTRRKALKISIDGKTFDESAEDIEYLDRHFDIPDPGDLARDHPTELARVEQVLADIEEEYGPADPARYNPDGWQLRDWQKDDLARAILKQRAVLAWDPGGGKSAGQLIFAEACIRLGYARRNVALIIAPQDLHEQWQREAQKFLGRTLQTIYTHDDAVRARRQIKAGGTGMWITHYEALSLVGTKDDVLDPAAITRDGEHRMLNEARMRRYQQENTPEWRAQAQARHEEAMRAWAATVADVPPEDRWRHMRPVAEQPAPPPTATLTTEDACPSCLSEIGGGSWNGTVCADCGHIHYRRRIKSIASLLSTSFKQGVICVDELSMIRGDTSRRSLAVRGLRAACRCGATGTPISNYINDAFWGLGWTLGWDTARFPYSYQGGKAKFEEDFCVLEYLMGRADDGEQNQVKRRKVMPEVTNVSMLWRLLALGMVRRRKEEMGDLVQRTTHIVEVPAGTAQAVVHDRWLTGFAQFFEERNPGHPLVEAGLVEKFEAALGMLWKLEYAATLPEGDPDREWTGVESISNWTPKIIKALELIEQHVRQGEKVLVGSCLVDLGPLVCDLLNQRGIRAGHITEKAAGGKSKTKNPRARAREVTQFINGESSVLCAGVQAMKLGHNLDVASTVVLLGLPWSFEAYKQFLDRVWRLTSTKPVTVYVIVVAGTIDVRKLQLLDDKGAASDIALDGRLVDQDREEHDWAKTLAEMKRQRRIGAGESGDTLDETLIEQEWTRSIQPAPAPTRDEQDAPPAKESTLRVVLVDTAPTDEPIATGQQTSLFAL
ncbi:MAG: hypothetical protein JHD16_00300 [Solirubrobacteraceae bacterium]|nr:hypothetical protein [Solirubrobacteraceae bacterium]